MAFQNSRKHKHKIAFKSTRLGSIEKTKSIGASKEAWNKKCCKAQKDTTDRVK